MCVHNFFLDGARVFHALDSATRYSDGFIFTDMSLSTAVYVFQVCCLSPFWDPRAVQGAGPFQLLEFTEMLSSYRIEFRPVPPRRHSKIVLESKGRIFSSSFLRRCRRPTLRISNYLYNLHVISPYETAQRFTRPLDSATPSIAVALFDAQKKLIANRKLAKIVFSY